MKFQQITILVVLVILFCGGIAVADWQEGDGHKMHYPQLPDPNGWDINVVRDAIHDDFRCRQTGPIEDVHFWVSWEGDRTGPPENISWIDIGILADVPADAPDNNLGYSHPLCGMYNSEALWQQRFLPGAWTVQDAGIGDQGWASPANGIWRYSDHDNYYQVNIDHIMNPFMQEKDTIYWLAVHIGVEDYENTAIGWKTSVDHWNDDAVYYLPDEDNPEGWRELIDPETGKSLDMAFVITPEPATVFILGLGGIALLRNRKRS